MSNPFSLNSKRILIVGGTRGIGRAISICFAISGASVIANYVRDTASADDLLQIAQKEGISIETCRADVTSKKGLEKLETHPGLKDEQLNGFVYCAATGVHRTINELTTRHFDWVFSLNVRAFFDLVKILIPKFAKGASIVVLSSIGAVRAVPAYTLIGASKGALESLSKHLAVELAPKGIRVNILSPGSVLTDAWNAMPDREKRISETIQRTPIERLVTLDEIALTAQFLCSDASTGIVGHTMVVDGGNRIIG